jgi:hypothetical protein
MHLQGQRTRSTRRSHARPGRPGKPDTGERGLDIPGTERTGGRAIGSQNQRHEVCAKMQKAAGVGAPDVVKATCPVRGALGGNPLSRGSTDAVLRLQFWGGDASTFHFHPILPGMPGPTLDSVSKAEVTTLIPLICKVFFPSVSTSETLPSVV